MKRIFTLFAGVIFSANFLFAQEETITLIDGSVYTGYVSSQKFGKNANFEITYSEFEKIFRVSDIISEKNMVVPEDELSLRWKEWANVNEKFSASGNSKVLKLVDMDIVGLGKRTCFILERGTKYIKCHSVSDGVQSILATEIHHINKNVTDALLLNSLDEIVATERQTYRGVIVEQYPGSRIKIYDKEDKSIHVLNYNEIKSISKDASNADYSVLDSSPYLEQVVINGTVSPLGVIIKTGFDRGAKLVLQTEKGTREYEYNSVSGILKQKNTQFRPNYDVILPQGEMRLNRDNVVRFVKMDVSGKTTVSKGRNNESDTKQFSLRTDNSDEIFKLTAPDVTLETSASDSLGNVYVFKANSHNSGKQTGSGPVLTYTYEDVFNADIHSKVTTSKNGTVKYEFSLPSEGYWFVLFKNKGVICLEYSVPELPAKISVPESSVKISTPESSAKIKEESESEVIAVKEDTVTENVPAPEQNTVYQTQSSAKERGFYGGINFDYKWGIVPTRSDEYSKSSGFSLMFAMGYSQFFFHSLYASVQLGYGYSDNTISYKAGGMTSSINTMNHYIMIPFEMGYYIWFGGRNFASETGPGFALVPFIGGDPSFLVKSKLKEGDNTKDVDLTNTKTASISGKAGLKLSFAGFYLSGGYSFVKNDGNPFVSLGFTMTF